MTDINALPKTRAEAKATGSKFYFTGEPCINGHVAIRKTKGACVECLKEETERNKTKRAEYFKAYNESEAGQTAKRKYYEANKEVVKARAASRPQADKRKYGTKHKSGNAEYYKALTSARRRRFREATPPWTSADMKRAIRAIYLEAQELTQTTGVRYEVDHIIPLSNEKVCGLHVPWNLQVMQKTANLKKSNRLDTPT